MKAIFRALSASWVTVALTALSLTGCGTAASPGTSGAATPSGSHPPSSAVPTPSATASAPGSTVISSRITYPWHWPNDANLLAAVQHSYPVPPMPRLVAISVGDHRAQGGERHYNRMSFTFTTAFPSYQVTWTRGLTSDPGGQPISLPGDDVLTVAFRQAQAHTDQGTSSIRSEPPAHLGLSQMVSWAKAGDFEGVLTFGIGTVREILNSNPQTPVRIIEVEKVTAQGQHLYVVAVDVDAID
jgi:hypothetical protein